MKPPLRIGLNPWPGYEFLYLADAKGFFRDEQVAVKLVEYGSLGDARRGFELGQVDGMCSTVVEVLYALQQSPRTPRIVIPSDFSNGADVVLVRDAAAGLGGLRGKRVAVEKFSLGYLMLARALERAGLRLDEVTPVPMDLSRMAEAMRSGEVDAAVSYPPESLAILKEGLGHAVFDSRAIPGEILDVISFDASVIAERADDVAGVVRAFDRAVQFAEANPDEAHALMAAREHVTVTEFRSALAGMTIPTTSERARLLREVVPTVVAKTDEVLRQLGLLDGPRRAAEAHELRGRALNTAASR